MFSILKPFIFTLDPEVAHDLAINSLKLNVLPKNLFKVDDEELLETKLFNHKASPAWTVFSDKDNMNGPGKNFLQDFINKSENEIKKRK